MNQPPQSSIRRSGQAPAGRPRARGFTLIELAVVIAIVGLLAAGAVTSFGAIRTSTKIKETHRALGAAELMLQAFVAREGRLPCPASPALAATAAGYGEEAHADGTFDTDGAGAGGGCLAAQEIGTTNLFWGTLPAASLGARVEEMTDGWDTQFYYVVNEDATRTNSLTSGRWDQTSTMTLWDNIAMTAGTEVVQDGVVAIMSTGANRNGGFTLNGSVLPAPPTTADGERENLNIDGADGDFIALGYSTDGADPFDDIVRVLDEDAIILPLAEMGEVETKDALTRRRMQRVVDGIFGFAAAQSTDPDGGATYTGATWPGLGVGAFCTNNASPWVIDSSAWPWTIYYRCDSNLRNYDRRIPQADSDGDGLGDVVTEDDVPFVDLDFATVADVTDAWGNVFQYDPDDNAGAAAAGANAGLWSGGGPAGFTLRSLGPNGADDGGAGDDIVTTYSMNQAVGHLTRASIPID